MTHNEKRSHWIREAMLGLGTGVFYGVTVIAVGHPFDTIKTKMQAQKGYENAGMVRTLFRIAKYEGIRGFYRGCIPPLWGSGIYRSVQFMAYEGVYTLMDNKYGKHAIPLTNGVEVRVICGGIMSGTFRAIIETPLEYTKTKRQIGESWMLKNVYTGFKITWARAVVLMPTYFIAFDSFKRHCAGYLEPRFVAPFLTAGVASLAAWTVSWPLEHMTIMQRLKYIVRDRGGFFGLYRGLTPGLIRSFNGNGVAMIVMQYVQKKVTELGLRD